MSAIDEVKSRLDIADVVGESVQLQRAGRNFRARCPFHNERTPSFYVSPDRQTWHCFGACSTGGDVFSFVMKRDNVEFGDALRLLAERAGVTLGDRRSPQEEERHQRFVQANDAAAVFFHNALLNATPARDARAYLDRRGLDAETIEAFQLGYAPDAWEELKSHLTGRGFTDDELLAAGLLVENDRGGYDRFRGRLMFPIRDDRGRTVGFGARALEEAAGSAPNAKYINTPQTPLFDKSGLLYGLDRAKDAIRRERQAIVVEGYMDVIAAHQHGIANVVASMGTALTERQVRALERLKATVLLALDADAAGIEATLRALQEAGASGAVRASSALAHPSEIEDEDFSRRTQEWSRDALKRAAVTFYVVPLSGKDPDEMIRAGRAAWDEAVAGARPFTDHVFEVVAGRKDLAQPAQRAELLTELLPVVRLIEEPVYRAHYIQRLARLAQVGEDALRSELGRRPARRPQLEPVAAVSAAARDAKEEFCLALLLQHPVLRHRGMALSPELFLLGEHRAIFALWRDSDSLETVRAKLPEELEPPLDQVLARHLPFLEGTALEEAFDDCVRRIELRRLSAAKRASAAALAEPDAQPFMKDALARARSHHPDATTDSPEGDDHTAQLAASLVEDQEMGRRLHRASLKERRPEPAAPPQGEVG